ncbi:hypothetical protein [Burkholderia oklahomensis]|uniref:hypothetical protein n=1 Tax=Burkholderia oklahomensis TaxID=342113 RepID=UPI000A3DA1E4|nr:hypothetical protein [Burkholderia oklahomensis]
MTANITIPEELLKQIHEDLHRTHPFAGERVGFITCRSSRVNDAWQLTAMQYEAVADGEYIDDPTVGASVSGAAFRRLMMRAHAEPLSVFHVHRHDHRGTPNFSPVDRRENARFVPDFLTVRPELPHGAVVLSYDDARAHVWDPLESEQPTAARLCIAAVSNKQGVHHEQSTQQAELSGSGVGRAPAGGLRRRHWAVRWWLACVAAVGAYWHR